MDKVLELMGKYCVGETNVIYERYLFNNRSQEANESVDAYATALRTMAMSCNFGALNDELCVLSGTMVFEKSYCKNPN